MMQRFPLIDTHCHLADEAFATDVEAVIERAEAVGVTRIVLACVDEADFEGIDRLCRRYPGLCLPTAGIHPENLAVDVDRQLQALSSILTLHPEVCALGEIGLDLHWDRTRLDDQCRVLTTQIHWAVERDLPILFHVRDAMSEFIDLLRGLHLDDQCRRLRGVMHCYSGTPAEAETLQSLGNFWFGVGGTLTYKKSTVPDCVRSLGMDRIVVETDAPYLAPVPHRGRRNEPAYVADTVTKLAEILQLPYETVAEKSCANAQKLLGNI